MSLQAEETGTVVIQKMQERGENVYENKGSVFHSLDQSGNVLDNKGDSRLKRESY
jgi:hypothetical protein